MILISHRGNVLGPDYPSGENTPERIDEAIKKGFDVEIDVRAMDGKLWLGHDEPITQVPMSFFFDRQEKLWCHAKDIEACAILLEAGLHTFFHDKDDLTLTSMGFMWTYPGKELTKFSVAVHPEIYRWEELAVKPAGVCSDFIECWTE
jgi:hypothetical protein